ncbi:MAG TPA: ABC transporter substrate-binding protein [Brevefilum fermentans]|jgi:polar amino acid transport system substrate-binding protein|uniref:Putative amino acid ABC transporter substrate binding protein n=1 Tax=Candidatus Brevifilum fermentans TaxID=1986204 RepID=A0A1Y6K4P9_9CHLR|nr:ABC transporter substrate-binding protein [Brevefilum fermentans]MDI9567196.1 ABC transporter substrate-binding protein [Chloroflexota bacterium]OQB84937.1 MAG: Arginine-binding extracellular protein ArtP precursor [Chloroflexi bacterium ADurb.Bin120]SMX53827.1 putative amino acid ABC transporter substrate binding protein [Brevefilum fermentans]HOM66702.1 ABC transporter substrate-binding protein [Brevefilum fermentans]HPX95391.1 ABC transporter substrate-binding protein [Brevefilum ferment
MKHRNVLLLVILLALALTACQKKSDNFVVGTSADYPPYEYVDEAGNLAGFDIELMAEIAKRMDVKIEWQDMPFDSLIQAVQEGKIDASISCFNYSEERAQLVDFSDPYHTSEDAFIAMKGFIKDFTKAEDAANYKLGVQSGTMQDEWITEELIETGLMSESNLSRYERVDQAALDLKAGRIDILMADDVPAGVIASQDDDLEIIYKEMLYTGPINIVLPKGSTDLQAKINRIIAELKAEGFIEKLAIKYFYE